MPEDHKMYPRHASKAVDAALSDTRVVIINGARQTGKSTLASWAAEKRPSATTRFLDNDVMRSTAMTDPDRFVRHEGLLVLDEVQRAPGLMLAIKHQVDLDPRPGRFLLTGSAQLFTLNTIPDLLPGRTETIELWPLAQGEIEGTPDGFVESVFEHGPELSPTSLPLVRDDYIARALRGGLPRGGTSK